MRYDDLAVFYVKNGRGKLCRVTKNEQIVDKK